MELDRQFAEHVDKRAPRSSDFEFYASRLNSVGWDELLKRRRVVVLAEAGSGKSEEFRLRAEFLARVDKFVFLATVTEAARDGFEASLQAHGDDGLGRWRESGEPAWFFLDSVDEAKSQRLELRRALNSLAAAIGARAGLAHVFLSGRPSDWEKERDLATFQRALPAPAESGEPEVADPGERAVQILRRKAARQSQAPEAPLVVAMQPLDDERVARFVQGEGVQDAPAFLAALETQGLARFARRPQDLKWLAQHWAERGSFGSLSDMLALSVKHRLRETNRSMARDDGLSADSCAAALDRVGAAMALGRVALVSVPDSGLDLTSAPDALDLADLLPGWAASDRDKLLGRAIFAPARAGCVKLDNDNRGSAQAFLAARWLSSLLAANCPRSRVRELLFAETYGERVVIPSMAETAAWLAISHPWVADEIRARDPWMLLNLGDPQSLPLATRERALRALLEADEAVTFARLPEQSALRRFAQPDMAASIRAMWADFKSDDRARHILLQLIWLGRLGACGDIAAEASFGGFPDRLTQIFSARALASAGSAVDRVRYGAYLRERRREIDSETFWDGAEEFFPRHFDAMALAEAIGDGAVRAKSSAVDLSRRASALAARIQDAEGAEAALRAALLAMRDEPAKLENAHPLVETAAACALRLLALRAGGSEPQPIAIEAAAACALASDRGRSREKTAPEKLRGALSETPAGRRALLWAYCDAIRALRENAHPAVSANHLSLHGARIDFEPSDWRWLAEDAAARPEESDAELAANEAMRIWREAGKPGAIVEALRPASERRPAVANAVDGWTNPSAPSSQEAEMIARSEQHREEQSRREAADAESWREFFAGLRGDPQQLRACSNPSAETIDGRIFHLWRLADAMGGSSTRHSDGDLGGLEPLVGREAIAEFAAALCGQWRSYAPIPTYERPEGERAMLPAAQSIGQLGLAVEARADPGWASRLSCAEAELAAIYGILELNGFPAWMEQLGAAHPGPTRTALLRCCLAEWRRGDAGQRQGTLDDLARAPAALCELAAGDILERLIADPPPDARVLEPAVEIVRKGLADKAALSSAMLGLFRADATPDRRAIHLAAAFGGDPGAACEALDEALNRLDAEGRKALVRAAMPRVFGSAWGAPSADAGSMPLGIIRRVVHIAHRETPPSDDPPWPTNGVQTSGEPDHAQAARSHALNALIGRPGLAAYQAIRALAAPGFPAEPVVVKRWARDRACADSEFDAWSAPEIASFETGHASRPRTPKDLQAVAMNRLADLQDELLHGEFSQGATVASLKRERDVQKWFADRFGGGAGESFSITRESHLAGEKEPDLLLKAARSSASLPIEIKVAGSWTLPQLEEALTDLALGFRIP